MNTIEKGFCECGCGQRTKISPDNDPRAGWVKGEPRRFAHGHNVRNPENLALLAQGKHKHSSGYVWSRADKHPRAHNGYVLEHVLVAEKMIGRYLLPDEVVHHKNGNRADNREENLQVLPNEKAHRKIHMQLKAIQACGNPNWRKCHFCHNYDAPEHLISMGKTASSVCHVECRKIYNRAVALKRRN